jgi:hypothetical protein
MTCRICNRPSKREGTCVICELKVKGALIELPQLQFEAGFYLEPSRTGSGFVSSERSIGINVSALDFSLATDLLAILHGWEQIVRKDRNLTPPAYVPKAENTEIEVQATCDFHLVHLSWSLSQDWAVEFSSEVLSLHAKGRAATKKFREQARRIPCPTDDCKKFIVIDVEQLQNDVSCFGCKQTWSVLRLVALAMSNPNKRFFLDLEAIALWLQMTQRDVLKVVKKYDIERRGSLYDLASIVQALKTQVTERT